MTAKETVIAVLKEHAKRIITIDGVDEGMVDAVAIEIILKLEPIFKKVTRQPGQLEHDIMMSAMKGLSCSNADQERSAFFFELNHRLATRDKKGGAHS